MEYSFRKGIDSKSPIKRVIVKKGEMVYTPPHEAPAMKFLEDSVFLAFATEKRDEDRYEKDLMRVKLIK